MHTEYDVYEEISRTTITKFNYKLHCKKGCFLNCPTEISSELL